MRITQEADYAMRITTLLAERATPVGAPQIAAAVRIPPRFAMKILRKLSLQGIVRATRGVSGGYSLLIAPDELSVRRVIEAIDGVIEMQKCLNVRHACTFNPNKSRCRYHKLFRALNDRITQSLENVTVGEMADPAVPIETILKKI